MSICEAKENHDKGKKYHGRYFHTLHVALKYKTTIDSELNR